MMQYEYKVSPLCYRKIYSFYHNVAKKYRHTYSEEMLHKNIDDAVNAIYQIERTLLRREPTKKPMKPTFGSTSFTITATSTMTSSIR